jgi:predicted PurR-regulated permease PerM
VWAIVPWPLRVAAVYSACLLLVAGATYLIGLVAVQLASLTLALAATLLIAALLDPMVTGLARLRMPRAVGAIAGVLIVIAAIAGPIVLLSNILVSDLPELRTQFGDGMAELKTLLLTSGLPITEAQINDGAKQVGDALKTAAPNPVTGVLALVEVVGAMLLVVILLFFLLKDGPRMWAWIVGRMPAERAPVIDRAGRAGGTALGRYARGTLIIAAIDAIGIGLALFLLGVPLAFPLTLIVFLGGFVPIIGATATGIIAVIVTLATNGPGDALLALGAVILVQQLEGNLLEPLIMGRQLELHPVVVLVAVTAGTLAGGLAGAVLAVPLTAVLYQVTRSILNDITPTLSEIAAAEAQPEVSPPAAAGTA